MAKSSPKQRLAPATPPSAPSKELQVFPNPAPQRDYMIRFAIARVHLPVPADRPARLRALSHRDGRRQALRRAQEPEDVLLELPQRGRIPRDGHEHHPRRHRQGHEASLRRASVPTGTCAAASTPTSSPSTARRAGSRRRAWTCRHPATMPDIAARPAYQKFDVAVAASRIDGQGAFAAEAIPPQAQDRRDPRRIDQRERRAHPRHKA